jgi:hypothetical protein
MVRTKHRLRLLKFPVPELSDEDWFWQLLATLGREAPEDFQRLNEGVRYLDQITTSDHPVDRLIVEFGRTFIKVRCPERAGVKGGV